MAEAGSPRSFQSDALSIPNLLTYGRVLAIPAVIAFMHFDSPRNAFTAAMIFAVASATDALDGWLARKLKLISVLGKFLDPLADKLLVMGSLLMLLQLGRISVWIVLIILSREQIVSGLRAVAASEGLIIAARELGKTKTAFQMVGLWALLVHYPYPIDLFAEPINFHRLGLSFLYISVFFSVVSMIDYFVGFARAIRAKTIKPR